MKKYIVPTILLALFLVSFLSIKNTALTFDETAHLPAGYSYLTQKDMRLNPEHPPILKDLAGLPLTFMKNINFPSSHEGWAEKVNGQWSFGNYFLFHSNNPANKMILAGRTMMILVLVLGAYLVYRFGKDYFDEKTGLIALLLYSLSPTLIAHGRLVTTDVGVAVAILATIYFFIRYLKSPNTKSIIWAGIALGVTQAVKFSAVFLVPYLISLLIFQSIKNKKSIKKHLLDFLLIFFVAFLVVYAVYTYHVWDYPQARQAQDMIQTLSSHPIKSIGPLLGKLSKVKILRPITQYLYGVAMVFQRGVGGNTTYFMGKVTASGFKSYFPILYVLKLPITFHILTITAIFLAIRSKEKRDLTEISLLSFILLYWALTLSGNLNIGVRHLIPIIPLIILLVARFTSRLKWKVLAPILIIQAISVFYYFPHFIPYYNEIAGGPDKGHIIATDSNLDWGQDLRRLKSWIEEKNNPTVYLDYFGGADRKYYLDVLPWWGERDPSEIEKPAYLAVSATLLQGGRAEAVKGFDRPTKYYEWLDNQKLVDKIGYSIFIYKID